MILSLLIQQLVYVLSFADENLCIKLEEGVGIRRVSGSAYLLGWRGGQPGSWVRQLYPLPYSKMPGASVSPSVRPSHLLRTELMKED